MGEVYRVEFGGSGLSLAVESQPATADAQEAIRFKESLESVIGDLAKDPGSGYAAASAPADIDLIRAWQQGRRHTH